MTYAAIGALRLLFKRKGEFVFVSTLAIVYALVID